MKDLEKIKERISDAIKHSGMTQVELAAKLHITQSTIAHYIKGDILPSLEIFANLCEVLDVSPNIFYCLNKKITITLRSLY